MRKILTIDVGGTFTKYAVMSGTDIFDITVKDKAPTLRMAAPSFSGCSVVGGRGREED